MGVRGLRKFLSQNCPDTTRHRDIVMMTSTYRRKTSKVPTIVVDAPTCAFSLFENVDMRFAGQFEDFKQIVENFVEAFRKANIKLVFFFDGWRPDDHLEAYWRARRADESRIMQQIMEKVKTGKFENESSLYRRNNSEILYWVRIFFRLTLKTLYKDDPMVEVYTAIENTRTLVIADYAIENDCVGILSDDTIYLYYTDCVPIMSCRKFDFTKMTTMISNRNEICRQLQIDKVHLKILAAITNSNSVVDQEEFYPFYEFISDGKYEQKDPNPFPYPFEYIVKYLHRLGNRPFREIVDQFIKDIKMHCTAELADFLQEVLMLYELDRRNPNYYRQDVENGHTADFSNQDLIEKFFYKKMTTCDIFTMPLEVMTNRRVVIWTTPLQDEDDSTLIGHVQLFRPIRQRLYGFIFNSPEIERKSIIECWASFDLEHTEESVEPILEPFNDLSLIKLWNQPAEMEVRMECLLKCFGFAHTDGRDSFSNIPVKFQPLAVVLRYMFKHPEMNISEWEISSFIVQAINSNANSQENSNQIQVVIAKALRNEIWLSLINVFQLEADSRAGHLAGLFVDGIIMYLNVASCCCLDLQCYMPWNYFDGKIFQFYYQKMKSGLTTTALLSENEKAAELLNNHLFVFTTT